MKVGDFVRIPTGRGRATVDGLLVGIRDNPADKKWKPRSVATQMRLKGDKFRGWPRQIVDVVGPHGELYTAWHLQVKVLQKGNNDENR